MEGNFNRHLGSKLRMRRLALGLTQTKVAQAINVTFQQIQKYEKGTNRISASKLHEFSKLLEVPVSFFFDEMPDYMKAATQATPPSMTPHENPFDEPKVQEFVKAYRAIPDATVRRSIFLTVKAIARYNNSDISDAKEVA